MHKTLKDLRLKLQPRFIYLLNMHMGTIEVIAMSKAIRRILDE
jgi:hypothetical protein